MDQFKELNTQELTCINGGGLAGAIATGLLAAGTVAVTIAFPPAGVALTTAIVVGEAAVGVAGTALAYKS